MTIFDIFSFMGALALFLFGMDIMGKALETQAGGQLQTILQRLTDNKLRGFFLGLVVTALIQSSSATTVMVVGFVNSGIMQLSQAIGIIMGANVGTTVTAWLLSLAGLQGDSLLVKLLKPSSFSPLLAFVGILLYMAGKRESRKNVGQILLGFAILMTGMNTMSHALSPLSEVPAFTNLFLLFRNPLLGLLAGALLTAVIQSSSASVGILQTLALSTGAVTFASAIPIIMGQNIGTCVTAMLSSVGATKNARRAAFVHLYFNIIGALGFLTLFYALNAVLSFSFMSSPIDAAGIALVHTTFNLLSTACLLPFTTQLEKLARLTVPEDETREVLPLLDLRLLNTPTVALERTLELTHHMAKLAKSAPLRSLSLTQQWDEALFEDIRTCERTMDSYEDQIGTYLVQLSGKNLTQQDSQQVSLLFHVISDLERIGDHAVEIAISARTLHNQQLAFSDYATEELTVLEEAVSELLDKTVTLLMTQDNPQAQSVTLLHDVVIDLIAEIRERHIARLQRGDCGIQSGIRLNDLLTNLQRISDHCANIAIDLTEAQQGTLEPHAYRRRSREEERFSQIYERYREKYGLIQE